MIDDHKKAQELIEQMKKHLPLPLYAGNALLHMLQKKGGCRLNLNNDCTSKMSSTREMMAASCVLWMDWRVIKQRMCAP